LVDEWSLFYNGVSEYTLVAYCNNNKSAITSDAVEIYNEQLYNVFAKEFE